MPWHLSLTPPRLDDPYVHRLVPRVGGKRVPDAAAHTKVNEVTFVQHLSMPIREVVIHDAARNVATTGVARAPLGLGVGAGPGWSGVG
jgi:hypothetical protein